MDDTEAVPREFLKNFAKEKKKHSMCAKIPWLRRSKRTGNDDSGPLRDHLRWNRSLLPSVRIYVSAVSSPTS
jgi:hypothetical protein